MLFSAAKGFSTAVAVIELCRPQVNLISKNDVYVRLGIKNAPLQETSMCTGAGDCCQWANGRGEEILFVQDEPPSELSVEVLDSDIGECHCLISVVDYV